MLAALLCAFVWGTAPVYAGEKPLRDRVVWRTVAATGQKYLLYAPGSAQPGGPMMVVVHGVTRKPKEIVRALRAEAAEHGITLVAPLFDRRHFAGYQRLRADDRGPADEALDRVVADAARRTGADGERFTMFGHSGGAQFVHRYAMMHPERLLGYVVSAAGWYTLPDPTLPYPLGAGEGRRGRTPDLDAFLRVPGCVVVGENDDSKEHRYLRRSRKLDPLQGVTRLERARTWVSAVRRASAERGLYTQYGFYVLPDTGHAFSGARKRGGIELAVLDCLFHDEPEFPHAYEYWSGDPRLNASAGTARRTGESS